MSKIAIALAAATFALGLNSVVVAADPPGGQTQDQLQDKDYIAALKKCDALAADQKQQCVDDVNRKFKRM